MRERRRDRPEGLERVPVTIVFAPQSGSLASLIQAEGERIVSDRWLGPGSITTSYDPASSANCARLRPCHIDMTNALLRAVRCHPRPRRILLCVGTETNLGSVVAAAATDVDLRRHVIVGGVTVVLDGIASTAHLAEHGSVGPDTVREALPFADVVALERTNALTRRGLARLRRSIIQTARTTTAVVELDDGPIRPSQVSELRAAVVGLHSPTEPSRDRRPHTR